MFEGRMRTASLPNPVAQHLDTWGPVTGSALPTVYALRGKKEEKWKKIIVQILQKNAKKFQLMTTALLPNPVVQCQGFNLLTLLQRTVKTSFLRLQKPLSYWGSRNGTLGLFLLVITPNYLCTTPYGFTPTTFILILRGFAPYLVDKRKRKGGEQWTWLGQGDVMNPEGKDFN